MSHLKISYNYLIKKYHQSFGRCGVRLVKEIYTTLKSNLTPLKIIKTVLNQKQK